jgi:hypothetical protein
MRVDARQQRAAFRLRAFHRPGDWMIFLSRFPKASEEFSLVPDKVRDADELLLRVGPSRCVSRFGQPDFSAQQSEKTLEPFAIATIGTRQGATLERPKCQRACWTSAMNPF